ncbi:HSPB1-associated protein 1 homolog isoform X2 [Athalia rosae]|uniref:HSPB1-associated protein 1 homolog isoform X2 n=1 Tax=Athalia rosae TaxID=37344 RepID=UPI0020346458|nr:HSPB1-associated protein 1 homolog isoform X2 [Athalia rosae]
MQHSMSALPEPSTEILRQAILELEEPLVFNNLLRSSDGNSLWKFLDWNLVELAEKLKDLSLPFRIGLNAKTLEPQWDFKCRLENMTMKEFLKKVGSPEQNEKSYYFDYKYMHEWLVDNPEILSSIDWQRFGFDKQGADSTMWIGSQGAHTNCHQDSYGCNLVAQIHGRGWWHYVESIDLSVSVNVWLPIPADDQSRLGEAVVKLLVNEIGRGVVPTSDKSPAPSIKEAMELIQICIKQCNITESAASSPAKKFKRIKWSAQQLVSEYPKYISLIPILETAELQTLLSGNRNRFSDIDHDYSMEVQQSGDNLHDKNDLPHNKMTNVIVNALCHPDVIAQVTKLILQESTDEK